MSILRVFIAGPRDVEREKTLVERAVRELSSVLTRTADITLEPITYRTGAAPGMGRPQQVIFDDTDFQSIDVFVGVLWLRFGSPSGGRRDSGAPFTSGTEEEFTRAYDLWKAHRKPHILLYRKLDSPDSLSSLDGSQYAKVQRFFARLSAAGPTPGLARELEEGEDIGTWLQSDLTGAVQSLMPQAFTHAREERGRQWEASIQDVFIHHNTADREYKKRVALKGARSVRLIARSGQSYVGLSGQRYREQIDDLLRRGGTLDMILAGPWSVPTLQMVRNSEPNLDASLDPVSCIENSQWYRLKRADALQGLRSLRDEFTARVNVRFTDLFFAGKRRAG